jgi:hypothetical protein
VIVRDPDVRRLRPATVLGEDPVESGRFFAQVWFFAQNGG